ncbi:MAG: Bug family tripartite tricarboxylate transporter substrate binding protein [Lautropia sp.]
MQLSRRRFTLAAGAAGAAVIAMPSWSLAQDNYPNRPIRLVVPLAPGGGGDLTARQVAPLLSERLGGTVVVENRPGAGGSLGTDIVLKSPPDGYTLAWLSSSYTCNAALHKLPFDPIEDLGPISLFKRESLVLVGHPTKAGRNLAEVLARAKANPGTVTYGSSGIGGITHLSTEDLANIAGVKLNHIAYKGTGPALQDVVAGNIELMMSSIAPVIPMVESGRVIGLGIADARARALPNVPSFAEAGLPGFKSGLWHAMAGPKGMPANVVARLNGAINDIMKVSAMVERFDSEGSVAVGGPPEVLMKAVRDDIAQWKTIVARASIKAE